MPSQPGTTAAVEDGVGIIGGCPTGLVAAIAAGTQRVNTVPAELRATTHTHTAGPRRARQNRAPAGGAAPLAVADLVGALGDDGGDAPVAQGVAAGVGGVGLVGEDPRSGWCGVALPRARAPGARPAAAGSGSLRPGPGCRSGPAADRPRR